MKALLLCTSLCSGLNGDNSYIIYGWYLYSFVTFNAECVLKCVTMMILPVCVAGGNAHRPDWIRVRGWLPFPSRLWYEV